MNDVQTAILGALRDSQPLTLTQLSERTHLFRRSIEVHIRGLVETGAVVRDMRSNKTGNFQIGVYSLPEVA